LAPKWISFSWPGLPFLHLDRTLGLISAPWVSFCGFCDELGVHFRVLWHHLDDPAWDLQPNHRPFVPLFPDFNSYSRLVRDPVGVILCFFGTQLLIAAYPTCTCRAFFLSKHMHARHQQYNRKRKPSNTHRRHFTFCKEHQSGMHKTMSEATQSSTGQSTTHMVAT